MFQQPVHRTSWLKVLTHVIGVLGLSALISFPAYSQTSTTYRQIRRRPTTTYRQIPQIPRGNRIINRGYGVTRNHAGIRPYYRGSYSVDNPPNNIGGVVSYPPGSLVYPNGTVQIFNGQMVPPAATVNHGDGTTSYYYPNGSRIDTYRHTIPPTGTYIR